MERVVLLLAAVLSALLCQVRPMNPIIQLLSSFIFLLYLSFIYQNPSTSLTHPLHLFRLYV